MAENSRDLKIGELDELKWGDENQVDSIDKIFKYVTSQAGEAVSWYLEKKKYKKIGAMFLRFSAIIATTAAGVIPLLSQISIGTQNGTQNISPAWASVALILAVSFVGLDRFFGFSSAWMRFLTTELKIRNALQLFKIDWEIKKASLKGNNPSDVQVQEFLEMCRIFFTTVNNALEFEMNAWKEEFQAALKQIEDAAKAEQVVNKMGGVKIVIKNGDICVDGWKLSIDGGNQRIYIGKTAAFNNLTPGIHAIKVDAIVKSKTLCAEDIVKISSGGISVVELEVI